MIVRLKMKTRAQQSHVTPKRIWSFIYESFELGVPEQRHLNICLHCAEVFRLCVTSDTFERVVRQLPAETGDSQAA